MKEAERPSIWRVQTLPVASDLVKQAGCADDVRLDECLGPVNRSVDVAFSSKMQNSTRPVLREHRSYECVVADVPVHEDVTRVVGQIGQALWIPCVCQLVEIDDRLVTRQPVPDEVGADKPRAASNQNHADSSLADRIDVRP